MPKKPASKTKPEPPEPVPGSLRLEYRSPAELAENPGNWRRHPDTQLAALSDVITEVGWAGACLFNERTGRLIDGHARRKVALDQGCELVPVLVGDWSEADEAKILATLDPLAAMAEADAAALDALLRDVKTGSQAVADMLTGLAADAGVVPTLAEPGAGGDEFDATPDDGPTRTAVGDLWVIGGKHRLLVGDCTEAGNVARLMDGAKAELGFTSPPYADLREYEGADTSVTKVASFIAACADSVGLLAVNLGIVRRDGAVLRYWDEYIATAESAGMKLLSWNVWHQGVQGSVGKLTAMFPLEHEFIFVFGSRRVDLNRTVENKRPGVNASVSDRQADGTVRRKEAVNVHSHRPLGTVVVTPAEQSHNGLESVHPARFPIAFAGQYIEACTDAGDTVLDPFLGSGTTLVAAHRLGRTCYGCELEPKYADVILKRATAEGMTVERVSQA